MQQVLPRQHRGFGVCEGLREGRGKTLAPKLPLRRSAFRAYVEGFEGFARAYA